MLAYAGQRRDRWLFMAVWLPEWLRTTYVTNLTTLRSASYLSNSLPNYSSIGMEMPLCG